MYSYTIGNGPINSAATLQEIYDAIDAVSPRPNMYPDYTIYEHTPSGGLCVVEINE